jgi:hypothetical protein
MKCIQSLNAQIHTTASSSPNILRVIQYIITLTLYVFWFSQQLLQLKWCSFCVFTAHCKALFRHFTETHCLHLQDDWLWFTWMPNQIQLLGQWKQYIPRTHRHKSLPRGVNNPHTTIIRTLTLFYLNQTCSILFSTCFNQHAVNHLPMMTTTVLRLNGIFL